MSTIGDVVDVLNDPSSGPAAHPGRQVAAAMLLNSGCLQSDGDETSLTLAGVVLRVGLSLWPRHMPIGAAAALARSCASFVAEQAPGATSP